jgi:hypothetical protein
MEKLKALLDKLQPAINAINKAANAVKNAAVKIWRTQRIAAIAAISVVVVATVLIAVLAGGKSTNDGTGDANGNGPKTVGMAFMEACINQDGAAACSYMPDFKFNDNKDTFVTQYTEALKYFIKTYYTNLGMELDFEHRQTYINLDNQEKAEIVQKLKKYSGFDENKVQDYSSVTVYLLKSLNGGAPVEEYQEITLIKYDGKWVVVEFSWPK